MVHKWDNIDFEILLYLVQKSAHVRGLSKDLKIPHATISRRLLLLREHTLIDFIQEGKNKKYFLKKNVLTKKALMLSEQYNLLKFLSLQPNLVPLVDDILQKSTSKLIILFGSYAKGIQTKISDIDIYIESERSSEKKELESIHTKISVKDSIFNTENLLIKEIIKHHVILRGVEDYYDKKGVFD